MASLSPLTPNGVPDEADGRRDLREQHGHPPRGGPLDGQDREERDERADVSAEDVVIQSGHDQEPARAQPGQGGHVHGRPDAEEDLERQCLDRRDHPEERRRVAVLEVRLPRVRRASTAQ